ncbi:MAG: DUF3419 family protein [Candidatus Methylacidiphilales bacterium]|nr:DUF3419 family protein [Candidatus Methylacidiphilales bacterium]
MASPLIPPVPQAWAVKAAQLPLAFAQVREDPRLDLQIAKALPAGSTVVMIASGGETGVCLGRCPHLRQVHLVDMNPAQLALSKLKWHLAKHCCADQAAALLGHSFMDPDQRRTELQAALTCLALPANIFGPEDVVAELGPDNAGRYEATFACLREYLAPHARALRGILHSEHPVVLGGESEDAGSLDGLGQALDEAFASTMSLENLVCLFGQEATQNPARAFHDHFAMRTRLEFARRPPAHNPFLWQMLAGSFPAGHEYDWLQQGHASRQWRNEPNNSDSSNSAMEWTQGRMGEILDRLPAGSVDFVHLSNILDWLSPASAQQVLQATSRVLRPGGFVIIRQLNSSLDIPGLASDIMWDKAHGAAMEAADRSFFYPFIHLGRRA